MYRPCGTFDDTYAKDIAILRTPAQRLVTVAGLIVLAVLPRFAEGGTLAAINYVAITVVSLMGLHILTGLTGQISLGHAAFMAVGAYSMMLINRFVPNIWVALPLAVLSAGMVGLIFGLPSLRIKGFYLAMATLAAQFLIPWTIINIRPDLTGGTSTLTVEAPTILGFMFRGQENLYYLMVPVAVLAVVLTRNLQRSKIGRAFVAIRDNDLAAEIMGVEIFRYKLLAFFICSLYAGLAGCLLAIWMGAVNVDSFTLHESIWFLGMIIVGGLGSVPGAVFGAVFIRMLEIVSEWFGPPIAGFFPDAIGAAIKVGLSPFIFGLVMLLFLIYEPRGLAHRWEIIKHFYRRWPFSY